MRQLYIILTVSLGLVAPAIAVSPEWTKCGNAGKDYSPDVAIDGCTALIQSGKETRLSLATVYSNRGAAYKTKGDLDRALADYNKAIEIYPEFANAYNNRGLIYAQKDDYDRAIADYNKAIELNQKLVFLAYGNRGIIYEKKGDNARAIADYRHALSLEPNLQYAKDGLKRLGASLSRPAAPAAVSPAPQPGSPSPGCGDVTRDVWEWRSNLFSPVIMTGTFSSSGTVETRTTFTMGTGRWSCKDGVLEIVWSDSSTDRLVFSPDGTQLSGTSRAGNLLFVTRK